MKLPIGVSDFRKIIEGGFEFVDKSLFIQDVINDTDVILITRPRRFGKSLLLSMLKCFFSNSLEKELSKGLFQNLKISEVSKDILENQGKYPVISISFKDIKHTRFEDVYTNMSEMILWLYDEFQYLQNSDLVSDAQKDFFKIILKREADQTQIENSIKILTHCLFNHHGVRPIILIDEYDTPIQQGYMHGYYNQIIHFFRNLLGNSLKDNPYLYKAVLTGILRISKESLFSDVSNIEVYPLMRSEYGPYFGFTEDEVNELLTKAKLQKISQDIKTWYNGYQIGKSVIYNPWSMINCVKQKGLLQPYWVNTSDNILIKDLILKSSFDFKSQFELLLQDIPIETIIDDQIVLQYLNANETAVWTLFLMAGYLKVVEQRFTDQGLLCRLSIPNREVRNLYRRIIETWLSDGRALNWYNQFLEELLNGNLEKTQKYLSDILVQIASVYDMAREPEAFYHGLLLGLTASIHKDYEIKSNRESGFGFFDISIIPKNILKLGIVIELKVSEDSDLEKKSEMALKQIFDKQYPTELKARGVRDILNLGIAFSGKRLHISHQRENFLVG